jgi:hypothetical protein
LDVTAPQSKKFGRFSGLGKSLLQLLAALVLILIAIAVFYWWDASKNRGRESGYWGEYNRVSNALASLPEVKIKSGLYNDDISLEAFQFDLETGGRSISLFFTEGDAIRKMHRAQMIEALRKRLEDALTSDATNKASVESGKK